MLGFLAYNPVDALGAVELGKDEFLLVFNTLGVYVDVHGMKSRDKVSFKDWSGLVSQKFYSQ